jgi:hypothetical protein
MVNHVDRGEGQTFEFSGSDQGLANAVHDAISSLAPSAKMEFVSELVVRVARELDLEIPSVLRRF